MPGFDRKREREVLRKGLGSNPGRRGLSTLLVGELFRETRIRTKWSCEDRAPRGGETGLACRNAPNRDRCRG